MRLQPPPSDDEPEPEVCLHYDGFAVGMTVAFGLMINRCILIVMADLVILALLVQCLLASILR
jgi:hypothetical protein